MSNLLTPQRYQEIPIENSTHLVGGVFNINNAMKAYEILQSADNLEYRCNCDFMADIEMLIALCPNYEPTLRILEMYANGINRWKRETESGINVFYSNGQN